jgi:hypothetical protein
MRPTALLAAAVATLALAGPASASNWPGDPSQAVGIANSVLNQTEPAMCSDGAGGFIAVWADFRSGTGDIYVQRVNAAGAKQWTSTGVAVCTASADQTQPQLITDNSGGAIIVWTDARNSGVTSTDIYAQRINASGVVQWAANGVLLCNATGAQGDPVLLTDKPNGAFVAWTDNRTGGGIAMQRVNGSGTPLLTANGVLVCTATGTQQKPHIVSDGTGGAIIAWEDLRSGLSDVYAQRVNSAGTAQWTANGLGVATASNDQFDIALVADNAGGALFAWADFSVLNDADIYGQHLTGNGDILWGDNGVGMIISSVAGRQSDCRAVSDGSGGMILAWSDYRVNTVYGDTYAQRVTPGGQMMWATNGTRLSTSGVGGILYSLDTDGAGGAIVAWGDLRTGPAAGTDLYAQRVNASGSALWTSGGTPVSIAAGSQRDAVVLADGASGAFFLWVDARAGTSNTDVYAQHIEQFSKLGDVAPVLAGIKDVPNDQGGQVRVAWTPSSLDNVPLNSISTYFVFRQVPAFAAQRAMRAGASLLGPDEAPRAGMGMQLRVQRTAAATIFWEFVASVAANGFAGYSMVLPTEGDSVAGSNPRTLFMVEARQSNGYYWDSAPDSGYSVDNLAPGSVTPALGAYRVTDTRLHWQNAVAPDLAGYIVHRGTNPSFTPDASNFVAQTPDTGLVDPVSQPFYYKIAAVDLHGNHGPFALVQPSGTTSVASAAEALALAPPSPNPSRAGTLVRFALPSAGRARVSVLDAQGRVVRLLLAGDLAAGAQVIAWDRQGTSGARVSAGLYFVRLETQGHTLTRRLVLLD